MSEPFVQVGILQADRLSFELHGGYTADGTPVMPGIRQATVREGQVCIDGVQQAAFLFRPCDTDASFSLRDVTIGVGFHWERRETQTFRGELHLLVADGRLLAINRLPVEDYLVSVISSEMKATSSPEFLKAHAVISRSWLLVQMEKRHLHNAPSAVRTDDSLIRWYDREDHTRFDVCADDHCQRYQGITRASNPIVREVIKETRGEVLMDNDTICDARFSKCCGGVTEKFENCWEPVPHSYLTALRDDEVPSYPDLTDEREAEQWIRTSPEAFCNTTDKEILSQVLNNYDQETTDFYRWKVEYTQEELSRLIHRKTGMDFGPIIDLIPLERGSSGRITKLKIVGVRRSFTIGKELEIRRTLSETHLYSSAFVVDKKDIRLDIPSRFILTGAGWGHGVGLCQIGAAVMGAKGYSYRKILTHYFPGASIEKRY